MIKQIAISAARHLGVVLAVTVAAVIWSLSQSGAREVDSVDDAMREEAVAPVRTLLTDQQREANKQGLDRLVFFSDAIFAIVITLLSIDIKVLPKCTHSTPQPCWSNTAELLKPISGELVAYITSFAIVAMLWVIHHMYFSRRIVGFDYGLVWRNIFTLLPVTIIPFATSLTSEVGDQSRLFITFNILFGVIILSYYWLWSYANKHDFIVLEQDKETAIRRQRVGLASIIVCMILLGIIEWKFPLLSVSTGGLLAVVGIAIQGEIYDGNLSLMKDWVILSQIILVPLCYFLLYNYISRDETARNFSIVGATVLYLVFVVFRTRPSRSAGAHT